MTRKPPHIEPEPPVDTPTTYFEQRHPADLPAHNAAMLRRRRTNTRILRWALGAASAFVMLLVLLALFGVATTPTPPAVVVTPTPAVVVPSAPTSQPAPPPAPSGVLPGTFTAGTYEVGTAPGDIPAARYHTEGSALPAPAGACYWARLRDTSGEVSSIITNGMVTGPTTITVKKTDGAVKFSGDCQWIKR